MLGLDCKKMFIAPTFDEKHNIQLVLNLLAQFGTGIWNNFQLYFTLKGDMSKSHIRNLFEITFKYSSMEFTILIYTL